MAPTPYKGKKEGLLHVRGPVIYCKYYLYR
jgi:hypothetical protein